MIWVTRDLLDENGEVNDAPFLSDMGDSLKGVVHTHKRLGQSNQDTIYFRARSDIAQYVNAGISTRYWEEEEKVSDAMLRNINKRRLVNSGIRARLSCGRCHT